MDNKEPLNKEWDNRDLANKEFLNRDWENKANLVAGFAEAGEHVQSEAGGTPALPG